MIFRTTADNPSAVIRSHPVRPGLATHRYRDELRFAANTAAEDEADISKVSLDLRLCKSFTEGFVSKISGTLGREEILTLPDGLLVITLELAVRFITDYIDGDVYFKTSKPDHNLIRARNQIALCRDIKAKMDSIRSIVGAYCPGV